jgi:hypothetical protein
MSCKGEFIGVEAKSCLADFRADNKWRTYLSATSPIEKLYFVFPPSLLDSRKFPEIKAELKAEGVGIMTIQNGKIRCVQNAKKREASDSSKQSAILKMAWRGGKNMRNTRPKKVFIE